MRKTLSEALEDGRLLIGNYASRPGNLYGAFLIDGPCGVKLKIMSSGTDHTYGWEHVSVSTETRIPNWEEMCFVKELFWMDEEAAMQLHPPKKDYINCHPFVLHLWRPLRAHIPMPEKIQV